jgi:hypothetical protein
MQLLCLSDNLFKLLTAIYNIQKASLLLPLSCEQAAKSGDVAAI